MMRILKSSSSSIIKNSRIVVTNKFKNVKTKMKKRRTNYCQESSLARGFFALVSFPTSHDHTGCPDKIPKLLKISILKKNENKSIERCFIPFQHSLKAEKQKRERGDLAGQIFTLQQSSNRQRYFLVSLLQLF